MAELVGILSWFALPVLEPLEVPELLLVLEPELDGDAVGLVGGAVVGAGLVGGVV